MYSTEFGTTKMRKLITRNLGICFFGVIVIVLLSMFFLERNKVLYLTEAEQIVPGGETVTLLGPVSLEPGVYRVRLAYDVHSINLTDGQVDIVDTRIRPGGLRSGSLPLYDGKSGDTLYFT